MTIPRQFQVFAEPVTVTTYDQRRLNPHRASWHHLNGLFLLQALTEKDLRKLVVMELMGEQRKLIIDRLLMRLGRLERREIERKISLCLKD